MLITSKLSAADNERFAKDAFDSQLGKIILMNYREKEDGPVVAPMGEARLVRADILEGGKVAELTFEILTFTGGDATDAIITRTGGMSFAFKDVKADNIRKNVERASFSIKDL